MDLSKKLHVVIILVPVFVLMFLTLFLMIALTQSAYSTPDNYISVIDSMDIMIGPAPDSTDVPLDTTITIDALSAATIGNLHMAPEVPIGLVTNEVSGPLSYKQTFYPSKLLEPAISYTVSVTIKNMPVSWSFTTTSEPYNPTISFYLATYALWIALSASTVTTSIIGLVIWYRSKRVD